MRSQRVHTPSSSLRGSAKQNRCSGISLIEATIALSILALGLSGAFATHGQVLRMLRHAKEIVAVRQLIQGRMDRIRSTTFENVTTPAYVSGTLLASNVAGDAIPSDSTAVLFNLTETVTIQGLGQRLFSDAAARTAATPLRVGETASQMDGAAPAVPAAYTANGLTAGAWATAASWPVLSVRRTGTGSGASTAILTNNNLQSYPQVRIVLQISWTDSFGRTHTQMSSTVLSKPLLPE